MRCSVDRAAYAAFFSEYSASAPLSGGGDAMNNECETLERFSFRAFAAEFGREELFAAVKFSSKPDYDIDGHRSTDGQTDAQRTLGTPERRNVAVLDDRARRRDQPGSRATRL